MYAFNKNKAKVGMLDEKSLDLNQASALFSNFNLIRLNVSARIPIKEDNSLRET